MPNNQPDALALGHDLNYLAAKTMTDLDRADVVAITKSDYSLQGLAMKAGLLARMYLQLDLRGERPDKADQLRQIVFNDPNYQRALEQYNVQI